MADLNEKTEAPSHDELKDNDFGFGSTTNDIVVSKDGLAVHPQPTTDPLDPLNWSKMKKHVILAIVMFKYVEIVQDFTCEEMG